MTIDPLLLHHLQKRGVVIHAPESTTIEGVQPDRFEAGVEIFPGVNLRGEHTLLGAGTRLGRAGGGWFENVRAGRGVDLYGGYFQDCVFLDGVTMRGQSEVRGGTLLEEECEAAHHVGYKMTIQLPWVVAGSLVNFCDALVSGGTSRKDHSEIGSTLALYNYTPWGDKFASLFGDVANGVFCRQKRIFIGGQTQIVSPVHMGFGSVLAAGSPLRRSVPENRLVSNAAAEFDIPFDGVRYGALTPKFELTFRYIGNLYALLTFYTLVRLPSTDDEFETFLYTAAMQQITQGIEERIKRLDDLAKRLPASLEAWRASSPDATTEKRIAEHERWINDWARWKKMQAHRPAVADAAQHTLAPVANALRERRAGVSVPEFLARHLSAELMEPAITALQSVVDSYCLTETAP
jgi:UDP-N-acetylglucosamine/UDP-N-acetylgalactosamine diphosphorylase